MDGSQDEIHLSSNAIRDQNTDTDTNISKNTDTNISTNTDTNTSANTSTNAGYMDGSGDDTHSSSNPIRDPNPSMRGWLEWEYDIEKQLLSFAISGQPCHGIHVMGYMSQRFMSWIYVKFISMQLRIPARPARVA